MSNVNDVLKNYALTHKNSWIGIHDTHHIGTAKKILEVGLCVSYNPFGNKVKRLKDSNGKIDMSRNFMTTMHFVNNVNNIPEFNTFEELVIVDIPKEVLDELNLSASDENSYQQLCGYGFQTIKEGKDENDNTIWVRGDITPRQSYEKSNVRLLPPYFIAGTINSKDNTFVENPKHFSKLPKDEQKKIIDDLKSKIKPPAQPGDN